MLEIVNDKLSLAPKCKARHLSTLQLWLHAWHLYEDTLLSFYPHRYLELSHYQWHIADLDQHFHWAAVLSYNVQFCHKYIVQGLPFSAFNQQLYVMTLNATAAKVSAHKCFWCQHFDHKVVDCPFPLGVPLEKDPAMKKAVQGQQGWGNLHRHQQQHPVTRGSGPNCVPSTTRAEKSVWSSSQSPAVSPNVEGPTCAGTVSRTTQLQNVILQAQSPLNLDSFQHYLACHPDREWSQSLLQGICEGVDIGYQDERKTAWSENWKSVMDNGSVVSEYLTAKVALRRKAGPFNQPPFSPSPMGIVIKKHSDSVKYHIIHDLSWPPDDHIAPGLYHCIYASFDQGVGTLMAKLDLPNAFKHILVHPEDWLLLGSSWDTPWSDGLVLRQYYVDLFLPFGLCSSPAIFNQYANILEFAMQANGISDLLHYLDDYFTAGPTGSGDCQCNINKMVEICREMGFMVNPSKVTAPPPITCFLGIKKDSCKGVACIDPKCLQTIIHGLSGFWQAKLAMKHEILSLIGKLHFVCRVFPPRRVFLLRMIETSKKVHYLHHCIKLNAEFGITLSGGSPTFPAGMGQLPQWCRLDQQPRHGAVHRC